MKSASRFGHRYPWDAWLSAPLPLTLKRGVDFPADVLASSMAVMLRVRVLRRGLLRTIRVGDGEVVMSAKDDFRGVRPKGGDRGNGSEGR